VWPRSDIDRRQGNGTDEPVVRDVAPLRVMHVHGMTSEQGFKMLPSLPNLGVDSASNSCNKSARLYASVVEVLPLSNIACRCG